MLRPTRSQFICGLEYSVHSVFSACTCKCLFAFPLFVAVAASHRFRYIWIFQIQILCIVILFGHQRVCFYSVDSQSERHPVANSESNDIQHNVKVLMHLAIIFFFFLCKYSNRFFFFRMKNHKNSSSEIVIKIRIVTNTISNSDCYLLAHFQSPISYTAFISTDCAVQCWRWKMWIIQNECFMRNITVKIGDL